jgi:hypothetical protein
MKKLLILALAFALCAAMFLSRPTKADFEEYVRDNTQIVNGQATGGPSLSQSIRDKLKTFAAGAVNKSAADLYLQECTYENYFLWTNVKHNGQLVYTGAVGHWFQRGSG